MSSEEQNLPLEEHGVSNKDISREMRESYLDYAMSVIVSRALPDIRDGLKPVQRRILYVMEEMGLSSGARYKKSARIVGNVMGKYHPHGDASIYATMVRLAQPFALRYPLVDGQGNFGSIDGDPAAAPRYTEARMTKIAEELLADIAKETIPFRPNYDGSESEPVILPGKFPNLLMNGSMGIAVGMATNMPPNNLTEILRAVQLLLATPEATTDDIMEIVQGPDFPTSGYIYNREEIKEAYKTGRGGITMRARAEIEEGKGDKHRIVISEIPYQVNKANLVEKIAMLVRDKKIVGVSDIRDESNKKGIRIAIDLKRDGHAKKILNQLYKYTPMQSNFSVNMIGLVDGLQPQLLNIKALLVHFIAHRKIVIRKRTEFDLRKAQDRQHILLGLKIALDNIDEVIKTIRGADSQEHARVDLIAKFKLSEKQAEAILSMQLRRLAALERQKIEDELAALEELISKLQAILADPQKILDILHEESEYLIEKFGDERRTEVVPHALGKFKLTDTIPNDDMIVTLTVENYIKRMPSTTFKIQKRGGKGVKGLSTKDSDSIMQMMATKNHNKLLFFTNTGRVFALHTYEIAEASRQAKGQALINLLQLQPDEKIVSMLDITANKDLKYLFMSTKKGVVKKTASEEFDRIMASGKIAIRIKDEDELLWVKGTNGDSEVCIVTSAGQCIRFKEEDVRSMGRASSGVRGIKLKGDDVVVEMSIIPEGEAFIFVITENGMGKKSPLHEYRLQGRGGSGIKTVAITKRTGTLMGARIIEKDAEGDLILVSHKGQVLRTAVKSLPKRGRVTQGVFIMRFKEKGDSIASFSLVDSTPELEEDGEE